MAGRVKVKLDHRAIGRYLKSDAVERLLLEVGERVKANAEQQDVQVNTGARRGPMPYLVKSDPADDRARVFVIANHPAGLAAEAKYRTLGRAIDGSGS